MSMYDRYPELLSADFVANFDFDDCWTKLHPDAAFGELDVAVALIDSRGNFGRSARALGRSRRKLETFVLRNLLLRDLYEDVREEFLDEVAHKLGDVALSGHPGSCQFILSNLGRDRGFLAPAGAPVQEGRETMSLDELVKEAKRRGLPVEQLL